MITRRQAGTPSQTFKLALDRFTSFGDLLKFLRRRAGLTQRELSTQVGYSHAQVSRLELNQRPPDVATITARFVPALDLDDNPQAAERLLDLAAMPGEAPPAAGTAPFKGLRYFEEADADLFFGREALTAKLLDRIRASLASTPPSRFLAVVGASGSGKSSIVRAGLIPAMRTSRSFDGWMIHSFTPTARPLQKLAESLSQNGSSLAATATLMDDLAAEPRTLHLMAGRLRSSLEGKRVEPTRPSTGHPHQLLVIDQFEELFSLCQQEVERRAFIDNLMTAVSEPDGPAYVVITLRADFYNSCAPYAELRDALAGQQEYIGPMSAGELRRAIEEPAKRGGWGLEPGLVELLLQDVGAEGDTPPEPGAMPLLSHALLETWHRRRGRMLGVSGYLASGGVRGAIAETADVVFHDQLDDKQRAIARNIFLRLTHLGENESIAETRRRVAFDELILRPEDAPAVREVLTILADARLITTDNNVAEVAHEALIREWPTLREWLEEDREGLRLHRHLTLAADSWERRGRELAELYRGTRLAQALSWAGDHASQLSGLERSFLDDSRVQAERGEAEREAQRRRELEAAQALAETQRKAAAQLRRRALYLFGAFILALGMAGLALLQGERARQSAITAESERRISFARELAAAAVNNLDIDPERSILLSLQAASLTRAPDGSLLPEVEEALHRSILGSQVRLTLTGHSAWVYSAAFSPDGKRLATIGRDGTTIVWDAASGEELLRLPGTTEPSDYRTAQRVDFNPDGEWLATADSNLIRIWDADSGNLIRTLSGHSADVTALAFSPEGQRLATGSQDATARIWDLTSGAELHVMTDHTEAIEELAFSPDGDWLATASDDRSLKIWDVATGELLRDLTGFTIEIYSVAFSPDGTRMSATTDAGIQIWDATRIELQELLTIEDPGGALMFSPDGTKIAAGSGSAAKLWDVRTGQELLTLTGHSNWVMDVVFSPDGKRLATTSLDETAKVWSITPGQEVVTLSGQGARVAYSPDGTQMATEGAMGTAMLWDAVTGEARLTLAGHTEPVLGLAFRPDGRRLATSSFDASSIIWDTFSGQKLLTLVGHTVGVRDVAYSPDGTRIATGGFDTTARVWDAATGRELSNLVGHEGLVLGVAFSPDGTRLATSSTDLTARIWDLNTGNVLLTLAGHSNPIPDIAFSPDGTRVATGSQDATAKLWDAVTGVELHTLAGHSSEIQSVAFSPDGRWLATGSGDNTAKIWDVSTGQELHTLFGSLGGVTGVAFNPMDDRPLLAVASTDGVVRVYLVDNEELLELAESRVTRSLTLAECQRFLHLQQCPASDL